MKNYESITTEYMFILVCGLVLFVVLSVGIILICSVTLQKVKNMKNYCDEQFDKISKQINDTNQNTSDLTKAVQQLNNNLKKSTI